MTKKKSKPSRRWTKPPSNYFVEVEFKDGGLMRTETESFGFYRDAKEYIKERKIFGPALSVPGNYNAHRIYRAKWTRIKG